jgi:hypothetical protein
LNNSFISAEVSYFMKLEMTESETLHCIVVMSYSATAGLLMHKADKGHFWEHPKGPRFDSNCRH